MYILDIFAGAGGLAEGFITEGFIPLAHVEMDKDAVNTLTTRTVYHYLKSRSRLDLYINYLKNEITREELYNTLPERLLNSIINESISSGSLERIYKIIDNNMSIMGCSVVDVLIGGPPCQTYSIISRNNKNYQNQEDQRNHLYKLYAEILEKYSPKCFVFENVPGIKTIERGAVFRQLISLIESKGYIVQPMVLNACDFGVLQNRTRVIITGWRNDIAIQSIKFQASDNNYLVNDLLFDLPSLEPGEENNIYCSESSDFLRSSGIMTTTSSGGMMNPIRV